MLCPKAVSLSSIWLQAEHSFGLDISEQYLNCEEPQQGASGLSGAWTTHHN